MKRASEFIKGSAILFEDDNFIVIATGAKGKASASHNGKTGKMVPIWILVKAHDPRTALLNGADSIVCFNCSLRGVLGKKRGCYVRLEQAPLSIWKAYHNGRYRFLPIADYPSFFGGRKVRFGAYGEPVKIPFAIVAEIVRVSAPGHTGYTHQWSNPAFQAYRAYFQASTTDKDDAQALAMGWRTFCVQPIATPGKIVCPASAERGKKLTCADCGLCGGLSARSPRSVTIRPHGAGAKYAKAA